ncbi:tripartite ATP-independent transporter DctP family solute receptor [Mesocricetibacter intestinalis]|uniref:Tripartite ATP-independent transporter DctP family solute receptor n=1 Tax=Mesocricetibacter intestinalis TaxID=1521930 RepID=A0A4R6VI89_9PAST|nr:TRAP transporter substrate-binding protein [Mesocricetibacter intestinalis]TDQ58084.1 tripartite ATP-independent transporter DctP family solute receptor [Mesocricetibacter intestinalis]
MKKKNIFIKCLIASSLLISLPSFAKTIIKLGHYNSDTHSSHIALTEYFKKTIEEKTEGRYEIRIFPNNQLGGEDQIVNGLRNGTIEAGITGLLLQNVDPIFGVWEWPYLFKNNEEAKKVFDAPIATEIGTKMEKYGIKLLAYGMNGFRVISSNKKIEQFSDFKGLRLRVPLNSLFVDWAKSMNINAQSMPLSEVFTALEQKVIDGQENPYALIKESGLYEVQKYIVQTNHIFSPGLLQISLKAWNKISDEDKKVFEQAAKLYQEKQWELAIKSEQEVKKFLSDNGKEIIIPDEKFQSEMLNASKTLYENFYKKYSWGEDIINKINNAK